MKTRFTILFSLLTAAVFGQVTAPAIQWQKSLGGSYPEHGSAIRQTTDGGYIMAGYSNSNTGNVSGNHGGSDCWIVKVNAIGALQWQKSFGGSGTDDANTIQQTKDGGYIVAGTSRSPNDGNVTGNHGGLDYWILKLNSTGALQWQKSLGGGNDEGANAIEQTTDGGYIVAGYTTSADGDVVGHHGGYDGWLVKLNDTGAIQWQIPVGSATYDYFNDIHQTADGGYIVAGSFLGARGSYDAWVLKFSSTGAIQWQKSLGGSRSDGASTIQQTKDGGYIMAGSTRSTDGDVIGGHATATREDGWVVKLNDTGAIQWQKPLGGSGYDYGTSAVQTADNGYLVTGSSGSRDGDVTGNSANTTGSFDYWMVKLTDTGAIQWQKPLGGILIDEAADGIQTADGGYIAIGYSESNDRDVTGNHGDSDFWIVKLYPESPTATSNVVALEGLSLFPNPATTELVLQSPEPLRSVYITDFSGRTVYQSQISGTTVAIPAATLPDGLYMVQVQTTNGVITRNVLIQHP